MNGQQPVISKPEPRCANLYHCVRCAYSGCVVGACKSGCSCEPYHIARVLGSQLIRDIETVSGQIVRVAGIYEPVTDER